MKSKRLLILVIVMILALSVMLMACGGDDEEAPIDPNAQAPVTPQTPTQPEKWGPWVLEKTPTEKETGLIKRVNENKKEETFVLPTLNDKAYQKETIESTCSAVGVDIYKIKPNSGEIFEIRVDRPLLPHNYGDWNVINEPTCEENGFRQRVCKDCGYVDSDIMKALGHDFGDVQYVWNNDYTECIAKRVCKTDSAHVEKAVGEIKANVVPATCEEAGVGEYVATFEEPWAKRQVLKKTFEPLGHKYLAPKYEFSLDYTECTARLVCSNDPTHLIEETVKTTKIVNPTEDDVIGDITYVAKFKSDWATEQKKTIKYEENHTHKFGPLSDTQYVWSDDNSTCTASRHCVGGCNYVESLTVKTIKSGQEPTCEKMGNVTYSAVFGVDWTETQEKNIILPIVPHEYNETTYEWSGDHAECTAKRVCRFNSAHFDVRTVKSKVNKVDATCLIDGYAEFTVHFGVDWAEDKTETVPIKALGHNYGEPTYTWSPDYMKCTETKICKNDKSHVDIRTISAVKEEIIGTCIDGGKIVYTAVFDDKTTKVMEVPTPPLGHKFGTEVKYSWSEDKTSCTATRECIRDGVIQSVTKNSTIVKVEPTCTQDGLITYTVDFNNDWAVQQVKVVTIAKLGHKFESKSLTATGFDTVNMEECANCHELKVAVKESNNKAVAKTKLYDGAIDDSTITKIDTLMKSAKSFDLKVVDAGVTTDYSITENAILSANKKLVQVNGKEYNFKGSNYSSVAMNKKSYTQEVWKNVSALLSDTSLKVERVDNKFKYKDSTDTVVFEVTILESSIEVAFGQKVITFSNIDGYVNYSIISGTYVPSII